MKAIETTATLDAQERLVLDANLAGLKGQQARVIILIPEEAEGIAGRTWLQAAARNAAFDFFMKDEEEHYTLFDGKPFNAQR